METEPSTLTFVGITYRSMLEGDSPRMVVQFTRSENNFGDLATKNVTEAVYSKLAPMLKDGRIAHAITLTNTKREDVSNHRVHMVGVSSSGYEQFWSSYGDGCATEIDDPG